MTTTPAMNAASESGDRCARGSRISISPNPPPALAVATALELFRPSAPERAGSTRDDEYNEDQDTRRVLANRHRNDPSNRREPQAGDEPEEEWQHCTPAPDVGGHMFARVDSLQVKTNAGGDFARVFGNEIIPALRQQPGLKDVIVFADPGGPEVIAISLWSSREDAETYARGAYLGLLSRLATLIERTPSARTFQLAYSSLHPAGVATFPSQSAITTPIGSPGA